MANEAIIEIYRERKARYQKDYEKQQAQHRRLSLLRLLSVVIAILCFYLFTRDQEDAPLLIGLGAVACFVALMIVHRKVIRKREVARTLAAINQDEISYLEDSVLTFGNGAVYQDDSHAYSADLDLFGQRSLYQHLNRTATEMGRRRLARDLEEGADITTLRERQQAVEALTGDLDARQQFFVSGRMAQDKGDNLDRLLQWTREEAPGIPLPVRILSYLLPAALAVAVLLYAVTRNELYWSILNKLVPLNMLVFFFQYKFIRKAMFSTEKVNEMLLSYGAMLEQIETQPYQAAYLQQMQAQLSGPDAGSRSLAQLSKIFSRLETIQNPFSAFIMNGLFLYHIHQLQQLNHWKQRHRQHLETWLQLIGEMEVLQSLANLKFNNPGFCFPQLNDRQELSFHALGHPLIREEKRVCNDVSFRDRHFMILTGSNMSGKSTFLRTLGVNMVLAAMGAPICAASATVQPLRLLVSMRQSDSLADSESYFFAEVKRLQFIIRQLQEEPCFVLLDEILRGTNSDDKRSGTVGVIERLLSGRAFGVIATHDLEVCLTTDRHPAVLVNKCFEVAIIDNELVFDYKLHDGICQNKSATFLMRKMQII